MSSSVCSRAILFILLFLTLFSIANAVPMVLSHQGRLLDATDQPLSGTYTIIYSIHDASLGGNQLWMEDHAGVVVTDGLFSVVLGGTVPLSADVLTGSGGGGGGGASRYLQVQISGQPPIMPRTQLVSTPYSVASSRVAGDIVTAPSALHIFGVDSAATIEMFAETVAGKKVAKFKAGSELAATVNKREVAITAAEDSAGIAIDEGGVHRFHVSSSSGAVGSNGEVSLLLSNVCCLDDDSDDDGVPDRGVALVSNHIGNKLAIKTKGTGTDASKTAACSAISSIPIAGALARFECTVDEDGDGVNECEISQAVTPVTSGVAIKWKGTGADANRTASIVTGTAAGTATTTSTIDDDNDGVPEASHGVSLGVGVTSVKGTFTVPSRLHPNTTTETSNTATDGLCRVSRDSDDDGLSDGDVSLIVNPTSCGVAINQKGTGADKGRLVIQSSSSGLTPEVSVVLDHDSDGDGVPEQTISSAIVPTRAQHAVNTKGTGAQIGRVVSVSSSTDVDSAQLEVSLDDDGDGSPESKVRQHSNAAVAEIVVTKNQDTSDGRIRISVTADSTVLDLGHHSSVTGTLKLQVGSAGAVNPIEHSSGAHLTAGGVWTNASDANLKENFRSVDGVALLKKIEELPVNQWNYKAESDAVTHIGPTAQDFQEVFGVGENDKTISTIDPSGIALAAIKELSKQNQLLKAQSNDLANQNRELLKQNADIKRQMEALAKKVEELATRK